MIAICLSMQYGPVFLTKPLFDKNSCLWTNRPTMSPFFHNILNIHCRQPAHVSSTLAGPHLCQQVIRQSAHVIPGPPLVKVHLCLHGNCQKLSAHTDNSCYFRIRILLFRLYSSINHWRGLHRGSKGAGRLPVDSCVTDLRSPGLPG